MIWHKQLLVYLLRIVDLFQEKQLNIFLQAEQLRFVETVTNFRSEGAVSDDADDVWEMDLIFIYLFADFSLELTQSYFLW